MYNPKLAVFSTKYVVNEGKEIVYVVHDMDGEWQFLSEDKVTVEDLMIISLGSLLTKDPSLNDIVSIEPGHKAMRNRNGESWKVSKIVD
jgi:hypothetical protein